MTTHALTHSHEKKIASKYLQTQIYFVCLDSLFEIEILKISVRKNFPKPGIGPGAQE